MRNLDARRKTVQFEAICLSPLKSISASFSAHTVSWSSDTAYFSGITYEEVAHRFITWYLVSMEVFSKVKATELPSHDPLCCAIELLPGATSPNFWVYPWSMKETAPMEEHITEALRWVHLTIQCSPQFLFHGKEWTINFQLVPIGQLTSSKERASRMINILCGYRS